MVENVGPHPEAGQICSLPLHLPLRLRMRLSTDKLFVSVDVIVGFEILATTHIYKQMANVLPNIVLFGVDKNLKAISET